jgi:hypothetical protein
MGHDEFFGFVWYQVAILQYLAARTAAITTARSSQHNDQRWCVINRTAKPANSPGREAQAQNTQSHTGFSESTWVAHPRPAMRSLICITAQYGGKRALVEEDEAKVITVHGREYFASQYLRP